MPIFEQRLSVMIRSVRAFLNLQAGVNRSGVVPAPPWLSPEEQIKELEVARQEVASKDWELKELRARLLRSNTVIEAGGLKPENVVWIFGTGRSGNTWLTAMMESAGHATWKEPAIGKLFGEFYYGSREAQRKNPKFVLGDPRKDVWLGSLRRFVLEGASGRSSWLDGSRSGGWHYTNVATKAPERVSRFENPTALVEQLASHYLKNVGKAAEAYSAHEGPKVLVKYEELRADALQEMKRIHSTLGMKVDEKKLRRSVEEHSWENIPEEEKGEGKFRRKASPGSWREDLTPEQVQIVEEETRPLLQQF